MRGRQTHIFDLCGDELGKTLLQGSGARRGGEAEGGGAEDGGAGLEGARVSTGSERGGKTDEEGADKRHWQMSEAGARL